MPPLTRLATVASNRAKLGATQGQLERCTNLANVAENTAATGRILDADYALKRQI